MEWIAPAKRSRGRAIDGASKRLPDPESAPGFLDSLRATAPAAPGHRSRGCGSRRSEPAQSAEAASGQERWPTQSAASARPPALRRIRAVESAAARDSGSPDPSLPKPVPARTCANRRAASGFPDAGCRPAQRDAAMHPTAHACGTQRRWHLPDSAAAPETAAAGRPARRRQQPKRLPSSDEEGNVESVHEWLRPGVVDVPSAAACTYSASTFSISFPSS